MEKPELKSASPAQNKAKNFRKDDSKPPAESTRGTGATRYIPAPRAEGVGARGERRHDLPGKRRRDGANERGVSQEKRPHRRAVVSSGKTVASGGEAKKGEEFTGAIFGGCCHCAGNGPALREKKRAQLEQRIARADPSRGLASARL